MTRKQAIRELKIRFVGEYDRQREAKDMAIKALEQEPILDKVRAEIEEHCGLAKENHCRYCSYCNNLMGVREILEIIDKHKAETENT
jgi:hypothetical protein